MTIELQQVSKRYGSLTAVRAATVRFADHKIYGLLGNNGAGKSTMLNLIAGRIFPDAGSIRIDGRPNTEDAALGRLFLMGEKNLFPDEMNIARALRWAERLFPGFDLAYARELAEAFELPVNRKKIKGLSTGYGSIFRIVLTLASRAPHLLFDEPVPGLDAQHRDLFYRLLLAHYAETPCTIILSTHLIAEVSGVIEHAVILRQGQILVDQPREALPAGSREPLASMLAQEGADLQNYFIKLMEEGAKNE